MPIHDWTRVDAGVFHAFHHSWIEEIARLEPRGIAADYYALPEQHAAGFGPDVLTVQETGEDSPEAQRVTLWRQCRWTGPAAAQAGGRDVHAGIVRGGGHTPSYVTHAALADVLTDMPRFIEPGRAV